MSQPPCDLNLPPWFEEQGCTSLRAVWRTCKAVGGLTLGADPIIGSMLALAGMEDLELKGFIVRKAAKDHGTQSLVEGAVSEGDRCVVIEDVVTTGGSAVQAIKAVRAAGGEVRKAIAVIDREQGGPANLKEAGCRLESIFSIQELLKTEQD